MPRQESFVAVVEAAAVAVAAHSLAWKLAAAVVDTLVLPKQTGRPLAAAWALDWLPIAHTAVPSDYLVEETSS